MAVEPFDPTFLPPWGGGPVHYGPALDAALVAGAKVLAILVVAAVVIRMAHLFVRGIARALLRRETLEGTAKDLTEVEIKKRQDTIETLGVNVIRFFVVVIAGLMILQTAFQLDIGPAIAGLGIAGIAIGLGTQSLVRDYLNGALILAENQYARVNVDVRVVYGTRIAQATEVVDRVGQELASDPDWGPRILEAPHFDLVSDLGEFGITLRITGQVRASEQWAVAGELRKRLLPALEEAGIEIPRTQRVAFAQDGGTKSGRTPKL